MAEKVTTKIIRKAVPQLARQLAPSEVALAIITVAAGIGFAIWLSGCLS